MRISHLLVMLALCCFIFSGCDSSSSTTQTDGTDAHNHDGHDHGHDHDGHAHDGDDGHAANDLPGLGPNGGHMFHFKGSEWVCEWCHYKDNNEIRMFVLDGDLKKAIAVDSITATPNAGNDKTPFELEADQKNGEGGTIGFVLDSLALRNATTFGLTVTAKQGDKEFTGVIEAHEPHDH